MQVASVSRLASRLALTVAVLLALAFPLGYFVVSYEFLAGTVQTESEMVSVNISKLVSSNPLLWRFEQVRLEELLARQPRTRTETRRRVDDSKGELVAESGPELPSPVLRHKQQLFDAGVPVGTVEVSCSLRPLLQETLLAALFGLCAGILVFRLLPYREIVKVQRKLQDTNRFLHKVMESSTNGIMVLNYNGSIQMTNLRSLQITGYDAGELEGTWFLQLFQGAAADRVRDKLAQAGDGLSQGLSFETDLLRKDGARTQISCGLASFTQEDDKAGIVVTIEDISSRKDAEHQLKAFAAELEESNKELRSFAYIISHDLRAPLVNVKGFAAELGLCIDELIAHFRTPGVCLMGEKEMAHLEEMFRRDIPEALDFINSSVLRMDRLINAVLKLSRLGHRELKPEQVDLREMVQGILKSMSHQIEGRQTTVSIGELPVLCADRIALEQIIGNLIDNAVKYLEQDRPGCLEIYSECDGARATIHVRDNGRGIEQEDLGRIFDIFRRAGKQDVQGEGMGLAYVKTMVRKLQGQIWCQSQPGVGSTFSFNIPAETRAMPMECRHE